ncbi:MAG: hypothetical protein PWR01_4712 [Clostridiales bacterium]|jgi:tetratricopeptide (TPR) repeat protein|nr:hypothetical protein [Clostridiales bacterium]MDN5283639.1 hypothetical protein [Candidatus Ozemobacter sp.]
MIRKFFITAVLIAVVFTSVLSAQTRTASATREIDPVVMTNQMMLVFMERMKSGALKEAREVAEEMIYGHKKLQDTDKVEYRSFHSAMEKELYELKMQREGSKKKVVWVEQPISDGYYLLAILDFQEGNHDKALETLQKAINWNPVRSAFYSERGFMFLKNRNGADLLMAQIAYQKALELADNGEDFAAALRGLAFVFVEKRRLAEALACLLVSKTFDPSSLDAEEEMLFIRRADPDLFASMSLKDAKEVLRNSGIQTEYSPEHIQVLMRLADNLSTQKAADKAVLFLRKANEMAPDNNDIKNRLKELEKRVKTR